MKNIPIYISTCDKTKQVLKPAILLLEKYWNFEKTVKIVGYNGDGIELPEGYEFISMKESQTSINDWGKDIASVLKKETSEHVIFMLDDMLQTDYFNKTIFNLFLLKCKENQNIVRCCLGRDLQLLPHTELVKYCGATLLEKKQSSQYRITTQPSLWRTEYLLTKLNSSTSPWNFETAHPSADGKRILGTKGVYAVSSIIETALSGNHPNKFNILGIKPKDVDWLIQLGVLNPEELQYGQKPGVIPQFKEYYDYDFKLEVLKDKKYQSTQLKENLFTYYSKIYEHIYK